MPADAKEVGLIPGSGRSPRVGSGNPLQYSWLENSNERGAWQAAVHGVVMSRARLSNFTFTVHFPALEKEMATHSGVLAWRIPGTGEPGGLRSIGSHRVGHDWSDLADRTEHILFRLSFDKCYGNNWVASLQNPLNPQYFRMWLFADRVFKEVIKMRSYI